MDRLRAIIDAFDSNGGHIVLLLVLALVFTFCGAQNVEKFQGEVIGGLLVALRGSVKN
jgi:hypothetical protein